MNNILILGLPASGKSTLAKSLALHFEIKHVEADRFFWNENGVENPANLFIEQVLQQMKQHSPCILEGHFKTLRPHVESLIGTIIYLDYPFSKILYRWVTRSIRTRDFGDWKWVLLNSRFLKNNYESAVADYRSRGLRVIRITNSELALAQIEIELR